MIEVNPGDLNLQTLAGEAAELVDGSELPNLLYVFGTRENTGHDYYIDPTIPDTEALCAFLQAHGFNVLCGMPYTPAKRPAVGISREIRESYIELATRLCVLVLLHINGRLEL